MKYINLLRSKGFTCSYFFALILAFLYIDTFAPGAFLNIHPRFEIFNELLNNPNPQGFIPAIHRITWKIILKFSNNLSIPFIVYSGILIFSLHSILSKSNKSELVKSIGLIVLLIIPTFFLYTLQLYKDVQFAALMMLAYSIALSRPDKENTIFAILLMACFYRVHALPLNLLVMVCLVLKNGMSKLQVIMRAVSFVIFYLLVSNALSSFLPRDNTSTHKTILPIFDLNGIAAHSEHHLDNPFVLDKNRNLLTHAQNIEIYNPKRADLWFMQDEIIIDVGHENYSELRDLWGRSILQNPIAYLKHRFKVATNFIFPVESDYISFVNHDKRLKESSFFSPILNWYYELIEVDSVINVSQKLFLYILLMFINILLMFILREKIKSADIVFLLHSVAFLGSFFFAASVVKFKYCIWFVWLTLVLFFRLLLMVNYRIKVK